MIKNNREIEFKEFSEEENEVWKILCKRQLKNLEGRTSSFWKQGWGILEMSVEKIPDFRKLNNKLKKITDWKIVMTDIEYEENSLWVSALANKKHRITNFIRNKKDLEYTPLPDIFHDVFGHIPYLAIPQYARIIEKFGKAIKEAKNDVDRVKIIRLGWYSYEFGLIKENGEIKAFGTGLISSYGELNNALSESVVRLPYDPEIVINTDISPDAFHKKLFVLEDLDQLERVIDKWFN